MSARAAVIRTTVTEEERIAPVTRTNKEVRVEGAGFPERPPHPEGDAFSFGEIRIRRCGEEAVAEERRITGTATRHSLSSLYPARPLSCPTAGSILAVPRCAADYPTRRLLPMDRSPNTLVVVCVIVVAMLAWAYFDTPHSDTP